MIGNTYLELERLKNHLKQISTAIIKSLIKSLKDFENSLIKTFTSPFYLI